MRIWLLARTLSAIGLALALFRPWSRSRRKRRLGAQRTPPDFQSLLEKAWQQRRQAFPKPVDVPAPAAIEDNRVPPDSATPVSLDISRLSSASHLESNFESEHAREQSAEEPSRSSETSGHLQDDQAVSDIRSPDELIATVTLQPTSSASLASRYVPPAQLEPHESEASRDVKANAYEDQLDNNKVESLPDARPLEPDNAGPDLSPQKGQATTVASLGRKRQQSAIVFDEEPAEQDSENIEVRTYTAYNDAIFEHFFNQDRAGHLTTLAFDDDAAEQIAHELAMTGEARTKRLCAAVGSLINPAKQDPYVFWARRDPRLSAGLLACAVLVVSRLGSDASGQVQHTGFHAQYNRQVLGEESSDNVPAIGRQDQLWKRFAMYLDSDLGGHLGRLTFVPLLKYVHLNYPASQCLVRMTDRKRLQELFHEAFDPARNIDRDIVVRLLNERAAGLTLMLQRAVLHLGQHDDLSKQLWQIIEGEYEVWRAAPEQVARRILRRRQSAPREDQSLVGQTAIASQTEPVHLVPDAPEATEPIRPPIRSTITRPQLEMVESRLVLVAPYRAPANIYAEVKSVTGADLSSLGSRSVEGWVRLPEEVGLDDFCDGFDRIVHSYRLRQYGRSLCVFGKADYGWIETKKFAPNIPLRIVYIEEVASDVHALINASPQHYPIEMADPGLCCISLTPKAGTIREDLPTSIADILSESVIEIRLVAGLRLRSGVYIALGPPHIVFVHPTEESLDLYLDGQRVGLAIREVPFKLPSDVCSPGRHVICLGGRERSFSIADGSEEQVEAKNAAIRDIGLGTIVARNPARMETSVQAEAMKTKELGRLNAVVIVGADLLLPYSRAILTS